ncbi:metal dependent hydrolase [Candidatus Moduliflexus flocculans]|uniref:Metal dependent hydrolase n=1 Tax=Candidatus Moduliflexus flocculans TaxID=1499966 RepID=A0A0S6VRL5_9BACT|nr:metal dependent hydrolase [Candidatus Moduliflexus flocculans]
MKNAAFLMMIAGILMCASFALAASTPEQMAEKIHWFGQATVKIEMDGKSLYVDPLQLEKDDPADFIFITHAHEDHFSPNDIRKVMKDTTVFFAPKDVAETLQKQFEKATVIAVEPGMKREQDGFTVEVVPAYNVVKTKFHPKANNWVGYIFTTDGVRIYHSGDTERIPEMKEIACDIALLPLGQTYTMNSVQEAADAALDVKAKIAIPIHYGLYEGKTEDADAFAALLKDKMMVVIKTNE